MESLQKISPDERQAALSSPETGRLVVFRSGLSFHTRLIDRLTRELSAICVDDPAALPGALAARPDARLLLFFEDPVAAIVRGMELNQAPSVGLQDWMNGVPDLFRILRQHRKRTALVRIDAVLPHAGTFVQTLGLSPRLTEILETMLHDEIAVSPSDPLLRALAIQTLQGNPRARNLLGELEASAIDISQERAPNPGDTDSAFLEYRTIRQSQESERQNTRKAEEERARSLQQLQTAQSTVEKQKQQNDALQAQLDRNSDQLGSLKKACEDAGTELERLQTAFGDLERERDTAEAENQQALQQIAGLTQELQAARDEAARHDADRDILIGKLHEVEAKLEEQYRHHREAEAELAKKANLEQRAFQLNQGIESLEKQLKAARIEVQVAKTATRRAEAELGDARNLAQTRRTAIAKRNEKIEALELKRAELFSNLEKTAEGSRQRKYQIRHMEQEKGQLEQALQDLRDHLRQVETSVSYRMMRPVRWLGATLRGGGR